MSRNREGQVMEAPVERDARLAINAAAPKRRRGSRDPRVVGALLGMSSLLVLSALLVGCGNPLYALQVNAAARQLEHAHEIGADRFAPYHYYSAQAYLEKAKEEAAAADYSDAIELAEKSEELANEAVKRTDAARSKVP